MLLADSAQAVAGKLYILGGGWSVTGPDPTPSAIAMKIDVPWEEANRKHKLTVALLNADDQPIIIPTPIGEQKVEVSADFEVGRPAGIKPGTPIDLPIAFNIGPIPLPPGGRYIWRCSINGKSNDDWQVAFSTRPAQAQAAIGPGSV
jgi:hypothetical protein